MIKVDAKLDEDQYNVKGVFAICPSCGQKMTDIKFIEGKIIQRIQCRRCRNYIIVRVEEEK